MRNSDDKTAAEKKEAILQKLSGSITPEFYDWFNISYGANATNKLLDCLNQNIYSDNFWHETVQESLFVLKDRNAGFLESAEIAKNHQIYIKQAKDSSSTLLSFSGDVSFADGYANMNYYNSIGGDLNQCLSDDLLSRMDSADIMMINNEFVYSTAGTPLSGKTFTFRAKPNMILNLSKMSADIVSLANNHVYDYGEAGLLDTLSALKEADIPYVGAGKNLDEAQKIVYFICNGRKIAYVSATQIERSTIFTKEAAETTAGVLRTYDPSRFLNIIQQAKANSDYVIAYVHWGTEGVSQFEEDQQQLGKQFIDAGADFVVGDHPHCLQGFEYYKEKPILYSLGNFWFNSRTLDTGLLEIRINQDGQTSASFVPCIQQNCKTFLVTEQQERQRILTEMQNLSSGVLIDEAGTIIPKEVSP